MFRKVFFLLCSVFLFSFHAAAQVAQIKSAFTNFEFQKVVDIWEKSGTKFSGSDAEKKEVLMLLGASYYSLGDLINSSKTFSELISTDTAYSPDPSFFSPKIIGFYSEIKDTYLSGFRNAGAKELPAKKDTVIKIPEPLLIREELKYSPDKIQTSLLSNLVFPGSGHFFKDGLTVKAVIYGSVSLVTLSSSLYFALRTNQLKDEYLTETNIPGISEKYDNYNSAYKMRNISLILFALNWTLSQIDLNLFSDLYSSVTYKASDDQVSCSLFLRF